MFAAITSMCSARILCRLPFAANSQNSRKQPLKAVLQDAVRSLVKHGPSAVPIAERMREVMRLAEGWARHQTTARLGNLVDAFYRLGQIGELQAALDAIPNRDMAPSSRKNLLNIVRKVARHREAARFLYRSARRFVLVRQSRMVLVNLSPAAFNKISTEQHDPDLQAKICQLRAPNGQPWRLNNICPLLKIDALSAITCLRSRLARRLKEAKIHTEI